MCQVEKKTHVLTTTEFITEKKISNKVYLRSKEEISIYSYYVEIQQMQVIIMHIYATLWSLAIIFTNYLAT